MGSINAKLTQIVIGSRKYLGAILSSWAYIDKNRNKLFDCRPEFINKYLTY